MKNECLAIYYRNSGPLPIETSIALINISLILIMATKELRFVDILLQKRSKEIEAWSVYLPTSLHDVGPSLR
jgi:hypothetical protein